MFDTTNTISVVALTFLGGGVGDREYDESDLPRLNGGPRPLRYTRESELSGCKRGTTSAGRFRQIHYLLGEIDLEWERRGRRGGERCGGGGLLGGLLNRLGGGELEGGKEGMSTAVKQAE